MLGFSNLIVLGDSTILNTDIYTTEKIDIINYDSDNALIINQIGGNIGNKNEILTVLFNYNKLFTIINNGCVGIGIVPQTDANLLEVKGNINIISTDNNNYKFTINNRDIIEETSNFIRETSNLLKVVFKLLVRLLVLLLVISMNSKSKHKHFTLSQLLTLNSQS